MLSFYLLFTIQFAFWTSYSLPQPSVHNLNQGIHVFRNDYKYFHSLESFYKTHSVRRTWQDAKRTCATEGATLFYPTSNEEVDALINAHDTLPFTSIYVGISNEFNAKIYATVDGHSLNGLYLNWDTEDSYDGKSQYCVTLSRGKLMNHVDCDAKLPFACKKTLDSIEWNSECNMPSKKGSNYVKINPAIPTCYKLYTTPISWREAYAICNAEQSYLAIIDNEEEASLLARIALESSMIPVQTTFHLGYHNFDGTGWSTIKGDLLIDVGYAKWGFQPDQTSDYGRTRKQCGSMFYNGFLNHVNCEQQLPFICEHDIET